MSELYVSLLSNVVAGGVDPGWSANKVELAVSRPIAKALIDFIFIDLTTNRGHRPRLQLIR